jgi:ABC-type nickel/cobalt efflux system permease component RcnA
MLLIGGVYLLFREYIDIKMISGYSEYLVGIVLIGIGLWSIYKVYGHFHTHHAHPHVHTQPEPYVHIHSHEHENEFNHKHSHSKTRKQNNITAISVGTLHGFAGVSHFVLILPTLALPTFADSVFYLSGFALGTILTMVAYALIMGLVAIRSSKANQASVFKYLRLIAGILAILVGIFWLWTAGVA